jgi:flavin-dependent dehydrogenase
MAIDLKKTDVVIVGLGAVGGVAAPPLARAGLDVVGLEAGSWLSGSHNPTLTAQALAWRTAEHLTANWKAIAKG